LYTLTRLKRHHGGAIVSLTPDQAKRKISLLSRFVSDRWGAESPKLHESIDQELVEDYEALVDPYILADLPVPEYKPARDTTAPVTGTKVCKTCLHDKSLDDFYTHPMTKDGRRPTCKSCMISKALERRREVANT
jgi:hypothetical protein